jgi:hypothetical protein
MSIGWKLQRRLAALLVGAVVFTATACSSVEKSESALGNAQNSDHADWVAVGVRNATGYTDARCFVFFAPTASPQANWQVLTYQGPDGKWHGSDTGGVFFDGAANGHHCAQISRSYDEHQVLLTAWAFKSGQQMTVQVKNVHTGVTSTVAAAIYSQIAYFPG